MVVPSLDKPNLAGIWQAVTPASFDIQDHQAQPGVPAPYPPWARDKQKYIEANLNDPVQEEFIDPQARCRPDGPSARRSGIPCTFIKRFAAQRRPFLKANSRLPVCGGSNLTSTGL
jgi:hypothetical protein